MEKAQMLQQAKMTAYQMGQEEHRRVYEAEYARTKDRYLAEMAANEAAQRKAEFEWQQAKDRLEAQRSKKYVPKPIWSSTWYTGGYGGIEAYQAALDRWYESQQGLPGG